MFSKTKKQLESKATRVGLAAVSEAGSLSIGDAERQAIEKAVLSIQSFEASGVLETQIEDVTQTIGNVVNGIQTTLSDEKVTMTDAELDNVRQSIAIAQNPQAYWNAAKEARDANAVIPSIAGDIDVGRVALSTQSFDQNQMMNTMQHTVSYNLNPEKQSKGVELFFPTIEMGAGENNLTLDVHLLTVFQDKNLEVTGKSERERKQRNILKGLRNAEILRTDTTALVPVFRTGENEDVYVDQTVFRPYSFTNAQGESITTSAMKFGEEHNIIGLSQTDRQLALGNASFRDQIAANPKLKTLILDVDGKGVAFGNLNMLAASVFTYSQTGDSEGISLNFEGNTFKLDAATVDQDNQPITALQVLKDKNIEVLLKFQVTGSGNTDYGTVSLAAMKVTVDRIRPMAVAGQPRGADWDLTTVESKAVITALADVALVGYELEATKTNSDIKEHGLILDDRVRRIIYGVCLHSPISVIKPVDEKIAVSDSQRVDRLIQTSYIRRTNAGVDAIYNILNVLKSMPQDMPTSEIFATDAMGVVGQWFVKAYVRDITLNVKDTVQSMQTSDRLANAFSVINNLMMTESAQAYTRSEYAAVAEITNVGNGRFKPHVIAMADPFTRAFIFREGDSRLLGDAFDCTIEECSDDRLVNKNQDGEYGTIFMSFGVPKSGSTLAHLHFGNTLSKQDIPRIVSRARDSSYAHEVMVQPWFSHVWHLPILIRIVVKDLKAAIDTRIPFAVKVN